MHMLHALVYLYLIFVKELNFPRKNAEKNIDITLNRIIMMNR